MPKFRNREEYEKWKANKLQKAEVSKKEEGAVIEPGSDQVEVPPIPGVGGETESQLKNETTWAMLCHLSALSGSFIPFGNFLVPLIIWLVKKKESELVNDQGRESLFFQMTIFLISLGAFLIIFIVIMSGAVFLMPVFLALLLLPLYALVMIIIAGVRANKGEYFRYPFTVRF